jgi:hypothetical protein
LVFKKNKELAILQLQYLRVQNILTHLKRQKDEAAIKQLQSMGYRINNKKDYSAELENINRKSQQLITKMGLKKNDIENIIGQKNQKSVSIDQAINAIETYRGAPNSIDPHKTTMTKWLTIEHAVITEINKSAKNG